MKAAMRASMRVVTAALCRVISFRMFGRAAEAAAFAARAYAGVVPVIAIGALDGVDLAVKELSRY